MEDIYGAMPQVIKGSPTTGMNLLQSLSETSSRGMDREVLARQRQTKMLQDAYSMLSSLEDEPDMEVRAQQYPSMLRQVASIYPEIIPYVGRAIPTQYDPNWSSMTVKSLTPIAERLKWGNQYPKFETVQQGDENVTYRVFPGGGMKEMGRGGKWSDREGLEMTTPDGTVLRMGGKGKGTATGLQPTIQKKVEEELLDATATLGQLKQIGERYNPEFATYTGQAKGTWYKIKEKAGGDLSTDERVYANKFYSYRSEAGKLQADIMRRMSGTAVTPTEEARQKTYVIDPGTGVFDGDSPEQVKSKLERFGQEQRRVVARLNYVRKNGLSIRNVPLETMEKIMQDRADVIEGKLRAQGVPKEKLQEQTLRQLSEEFGLVY
jgi:hypothetical protein